MSFAWGTLLRAAVNGGVRPAEFWQMTPAELQVVLGPSPVLAPLTRGRLDELAEAFPDEDLEDS